MYYLGETLILLVVLFFFNSVTLAKALPVKKEKTQASHIMKKEAPVIEEASVKESLSVDINESSEGAVLVESTDNSSSNSDEAIVVELTDTDEVAAEPIEVKEASVNGLEEASPEPTLAVAKEEQKIEHPVLKQEVDKKEPPEDFKEEKESQGDVYNFYFQQS